MSEYDNRQDPPAAIIDVSIENPFLSGVSITKPALLDTAADITAIPEAVVKPLGLQVAHTTTASGLDHVSIVRRSYIVNLRVAGTTFERISAIEWPGPEILLGRDVLNAFEIKLDGKNRRFEMHDP